MGQHCQFAPKLRACWAQCIPPVRIHRLAPKFLIKFSFLHLSAAIFSIVKVLLCQVWTFEAL